MAKSKLAVGLDIGSSSVKLVQLKEKKDGYQLAWESQTLTDTNFDGSMGCFGGFFGFFLPPSGAPASASSSVSTS